MPAHANSGSFKTGHEWTEEAKEKRRQTIARLAAKGLWVSQRPEVREKLRGPNPAKAAGWAHTLPVGTVVLASSGYMKIKVADPNEWAYLHRHLMETMLGRPLEPGEVVHHKDGDRGNNDPDNLEVLDSAGTHGAIHGAAHLLPYRWAAKLPPGQWARHYAACVCCGRTSRPHAARGLCHTCYERARRR
jgi:hypothetical protein